MPLTIRAATWADIAAMAALEEASYPAAEAASAAALAARVAAYPDYNLVAEDEGRIVGFCSTCLTHLTTLEDALFGAIVPDATAPHVAILSLTVDAAWRCRGIATRLLEALRQVARTGGKTTIILTCKDHLRGFYAARGYGDLGLSASQHGGAQWFDMSLRL